MINRPDFKPGMRPTHYLSGYGEIGYPGPCRSALGLFLRIIMADSHIVKTDVSVGGKKTRTSLQTIDGVEMHVPYTVPVGADGGAVAVTGPVTDVQLRASDVKVSLDGETVSVNQDVIADPNNSSTTNLSSANTYAFTGAATSTLGVAGIQVSLKADQNCTVYVEQSPDTTPTGPHWDISDVYNYYASINNFGITVQAINSYVRVRVTTASLETTYFRLQTALCPVVEALPRTLDEDGYLKVGIKSTVDGYGFGVENTPTGEVRSVIPTRLVGAQFEGTSVDALFWGNAVANGGTVTQGNAQLRLRTNTTANGSATAYSVRRARYVSASGQVYRAVIQLDAGSANNKRRWGVAWGATMPTISDGAYFQLDGTEFSVNTMKSYTGSTGITKVTSFNGTLGATYSPGTTVATYEIYWTNSKVWFVVGNKVLHTVSALSSTWADTMNHHIFMDNVNSSNAVADVSLYCRVASIRRLGPMLTQPASYYFAPGQTAGLNLKLGPGNLHSIILTSVVNNAAITLADSTSAGTPIIFSHTAGASSTGISTIDFKGIPFFTGLRLIVAAQNAGLTIIYE